jgi:hypothetical protein
MIEHHVITLIKAEAKSLKFSDLSIATWPLATFCWLQNFKLKFQISVYPEWYLQKRITIEHQRYRLTILRMKLILIILARQIFILTQFLSPLILAKLDYEG